MKSIDELIRKAIEEGQFDNLKGKGKPLQMDENPHEDPEWRMAHHVIKNSGFTLPWIEKRQGIEAEITTLRNALQRAWAWRLEALEHKQPYHLVEGEWQRAIIRFEQGVEKLNQNIRNYNLEVPSDHFQLSLLNTRREIEKVQSDQAS